MHYFATALKEIIRLSSQGEAAAATRLRSELQSQLAILVRRKLRSPTGRAELARWLGAPADPSEALSLPSPDDGPAWSARVSRLAGQLFDLLLARASRGRQPARHVGRAFGAARGQRTIDRPQRELETVEV